MPSETALDRAAPAPLYRDPVFDGAADPTLVWNPWEAEWWMVYTQRRAKLDLPGVAWCHGTEIGVARSTDAGRSWEYLGTLPLAAPDPEYSFWAPDIVRDEAGVYHLFVSYVPGMHEDWSGDRYIFRYTSTDLRTWEGPARLSLASDRCIDPSLFRVPNGPWRLWYKDEGHGSQTFAVESDDLVTWRAASDPAVSRLYGEAPKIFRFGDWYWLLKDPNSGLDVYRSDDLLGWEYQGKILELPGERNDDANVGKHPDVIVSGDRAFIFYFTHPHRDVPLKDRMQHYAVRRTSIQVAELQIEDGELTCDREAPCMVRLTPP
ncbi:MAG: glycosyl hydrolase [Phycisphaerales bacterium JB038]